MLDKIAEILMQKGLVASTWQSEMQLRGELVKLFREYYDGNHRLNMTSEMRQMMSITDDRLQRYNANYCEMVVNAMADRLTVDTIEATPAIPTPNPSPQSGEGNKTNAPDPGQVWVDNLLKTNRFDALQIDVREAALRDGVTFVMSELQKDGALFLSHELAWDGDCGTLVVYDRRGREIVAGVRVWYEGEYRRANIYYRNSLERYQYEKITIEETGQKREEMQFNLIKPDPEKNFKNPEDTTRDGLEPGVPIIPFFNKSKKGSSELVNVIPLQDSLNSTLISAVMNALLTAFAILFAKGWKPPSGITPGMILHAMIDSGTDGEQFVTEDKDKAEAIAALMAVYDLIRIQPGEVEPLIKQCEFIIGQIGSITNTPLPRMMGSDPSGEALKQYDVRLLGKINGAQVRLGNSWEDVMRLGHTQQTVLGVTLPPPVNGFNTRWKSAEIRNDKEIRETAKLMNDMGFTRESLRILKTGGIVQYTDNDIDRLMAEKAQDAQVSLNNAAGEVPEFGAFNFG